MKGTKNLLMAVMLAVLTFVTACGGGGGGSSSTPQYPASTTITGTAAAGAPIIGTITVQDSSTPPKTKQTNILADGKYAIDVAGMTGPFMLRADGAVDGTEVHLYSAAISADVGGTINVTPFTDLIFANIAGTLAKTYFDNQGYTNLTADEIRTNSDELKSRLLPVLQALGVSDTVDLLRISFSADHSGFDRVMDIVKVTIDTATEVATIKNIITGQQIIDDLRVQNETSKLDNVAGLSELALIDYQLKKFSALFAASVPQPTNQELLALFDQQGGFLNSGLDLNAFLLMITSDSSLVGITFTNLEVKSLQNNIAQIKFTVLDKNGNNFSTEYWQLIKVNDLWLFQGNQKIGDVYVEATALYYPPNNTISTNLYFNVDDPGNRIDTATVAGPGLNGTVTLNKSITANEFLISGYAPFVEMSDAQVDSIPDSGAIYEFNLYSAGVLKATYAITLGKRPYKLSELTPSMFPVISAATDAALSSFNGGSLIVSWTMPLELKPNYVEVILDDSSGHENTASYDLGATTTNSITATLEAKTASGQSFTPTERGIHLGGTDIYGRGLVTSLWR